MADEWYYTNQGQQMGPVSTAELKQMAAARQLQPTDLVWREGLAKWVPASSAKGLFPEAPAAAAPTPGRPAPTPVAPLDEDPDADLRPPRRAGYEDDDRPRRRRRDDDYGDFEDRPRRRPRRSHTGLVIGLIAGGGGLLLVVGVILLFVFVLSGGGSQTLTLTNGQVTVNGQLNNHDAFDQRRQQCRCKTYSINLTQGRVYWIDMRSNEVDSYLRLESGNQTLREDDDGGGFPNARIVFPCTQTGSYRITCTTFAPALGNYVLTVQER